MEYDEIKRLMDDMGNSKLTSIEIEFPDGIKISMKKEIKEIISKECIIKEQNAEISNVQNISETKKENIENKLDEVVENKTKGNIVKSPIVGTFYSKPSPTADEYVKQGDKIQKGKIVCIIEAMKLMNEIESEYDGVIEEIYVKDGDKVEYGTPLFRIV